MTVMLSAALSFYLKKTFKMHFIFNYVYMCAETGPGHVHVSAGACGSQKGSLESLELESQLGVTSGDQSQRSRNLLSASGYKES